MSGRRWLHVWWMMVVLAGTGCGDSGSGTPAGSETADGSVEAGTDGEAPPDGGVSDGASGTDGGPVVDGGPDGGAVPDGGSSPPPEGPARPGLHVWVDRPLLEQADEALAELTVRCSLRDETGAVQAPPTDLAIAVDAPGATEVRSMPGEAVFTFPEAGSFQATCRSASLGLEASVPFEVAFEGIDRDVLRLGAHAAAAQQALQSALDAVAAGDATALGAAATALGAVAAELDPARYTDVPFLVDISPERWPTAAEAEAAGMSGGPSDDAWIAGCERVRTALGALRDAVGGLPDPTTAGTLSEEAVAGYAAASAELRAAVAAWRELEPSTVGWLRGLSCLDGLVSTELPQALDAEASWHAAALGAAELDASSGGGAAFTFIGTMIANTARSIADTYSYQALLKTAAHRALYNAAVLLAADLFNKFMPAGTGAPEITSIHGSAGGYLVPGNPFYAVGTNFDPIPEANLVVFLYPDLASGVVDQINSALDACAVPEFGSSRLINILKAAKAVKECIDGIVAAAEGITMLVSKTLLTPTSVDTALGLYFERSPTGVYCGGGLVPVPATAIMIPIRKRVGHGPAVTFNVTAEGC